MEKYFILKTGMALQATYLILPHFNSEKAELEKLIRIFDLAFPAEPTGGFTTCCL